MRLLFIGFGTVAQGLSELLLEKGRSDVHQVALGDDANHPTIIDECHVSRL